jgi:hypothetical protein
MNTIYAEAHLDDARSVQRSVALWLQATAAWLHDRAKQRLSILEYRRLRVQNSGATWAACFEFDPRTDDMLSRSDD